MNLLQMSFSGAAFITAVVIIRAVAINKLPKKTFLVLWELVILRLLIPFSIPSMFSVYTLVTHSISSTTLPEVGTDYNIPTMQGLFVTTQGVEQPPADISSSVSMWFIVWCAGIILIAMYKVIIRGGKRKTPAIISIFHQKQRKKTDTAHGVICSTNFPIISQTNRRLLLENVTIVSAI